MAPRVTEVHVIYRVIGVDEGMEEGTAVFASMNEALAFILEASDGQRSERVQQIVLIGEDTGGDRREVMFEFQSATA